VHILSLFRCEASRGEHGDGKANPRSRGGALRRELCPEIAPTAQRRAGWPPVPRSAARDRRVAQRSSRDSLTAARRLAARSCPLHLLERDRVAEGWSFKPQGRRIQRFQDTDVIASAYAERRRIAGFAGQASVLSSFA
jgi:hypothetical protein